MWQNRCQFLLFSFPRLNNFEGWACEWTELVKFNGIFNGGVGKTRLIFVWEQYSLLNDIRQITHRYNYSTQNMSIYDSQFTTNICVPLWWRSSRVTFLEVWCFEFESHQNRWVELDPPDFSSVVVSVDARI